MPTSGIGVARTAAIVVVLAMPGPARGFDAQECDTLVVTRAVVKRKRAQFKGRFTPTDDVRALQPAPNAIEFRFGREMLAHTDPTYVDTRQSREGAKIRYVGGLLEQPKARVKFTVDVEEGRFNVSVRRMRFTELPSEGVTDLAAVLRLGTTSYHAHLPFSAERRKWRHKAERGAEPPPAPESPEFVDPVGVPFVQLRTEDQRSDSIPKAFVVRSQSEFEAEWAERFPWYDPIPPTPVIDFDTKAVVFLDIGERSSAGRELDVTAIRALPCGLHIEFTECWGGLTAISQTWTALEVPRLDGDVITWTHVYDGYVDGLDD